MAGIKRAVIVGINEYRKDAGIPSLSGAVRDAEEVRDALKRGNFKVDHFLTDGKATCDAIREAISDLLWANKEETCDIALFYFSGHGRRDHLGQGYLLPHDALYAAPFVRGIGFDELKRLFYRARQREACVMLLDCCYSGIAAGTLRGASDGIGGSDDPDAVMHFSDDLNLRHVKDERDSAAENQGKGRFILASAGANATAREKPFKHITGEVHTHGEFSFHLIEALQIGSKQGFGEISLGALRTYLSGKLPADHKPCFSAIDETAADNIILAITEEVAQARIEGHLKKIEERLRVEQANAEDPYVERPGDVMVAMRLLNELDERGIEREDINGYRGQIDHFLSRRQSVVTAWVIKHGIAIESDLEEAGPRKLYAELKENLRKINRFSLCRLADEDLSLVTRVMEEVQRDAAHLDNKGYQRIANDLRDLHREAKRSSDLDAKRQERASTLSAKLSPPAASAGG
jgi:hypothetical protein